MTREPECFTVNRMYKTPTLETPRLILRPIVLEDHVWAQKLFPEYEVVKYLNHFVPWPYPDDGVISFYKNIILPAMEAGTKLCWAIIEKNSGTPMGALELNPASTTESRGFWLGLPYHGKGYMSEVVAATNDYAFDVLKLKKLYLGNAKANTASGNIKIKSGADLVSEEEKKFVSGTLAHQSWEQTPDNWRASSLKKKYDEQRRTAS